MKKYVLIAGAAVLVLVAVIIAVILLSFQGQRIPTSLEEARCVLPVTVQGQSMEPAIKAGTRLLLDKCADKQSVPVGAIVLFDENNVGMVGRVKERISLQQAVSYRIGQDGGQKREFTVPADRIVATGE